VAEYTAAGVFAVALIALTAGQAHAQQAVTPTTPHPQERVTYDSTLGLRINPLGIEERLNLFARRRLYASASPLLREANVAVGLAPTITPSIIRLGPAVELRPLTILTLSAAGYVQTWARTFNNLQSFSSPTADHSDDDLRAGGDADRDYDATGAELQLRAQVLGKVGPIVLRTDASFHLARVDLRDSDTVYYDPRSDLMVPNGGWSMTDDTDLVWLTSFGLVAGVRATVSTAFFRDSDYAAGEPTEDPNGPTFRVGPVLAYTFFDDPDATFNRPTALLIANWWLAHRYRTGEENSAALPYIVLGFRFEGELYRAD
jgi:hypothetical protein